MAEIVYADDWNHLTARPKDPMSEEQARRLHESGEIYTAILEVEGGGWSAVSVRGEVGYVRTMLVEPDGLPGAIYDFSRQDDGRLFQVNQTHYRYGETGTSQSDAERIVSLDISPDGTVIEEIDVRGQPRQRQGWAEVDVEIFWARWPEFGEYLHLARYDRSLPPEHPDNGLAAYVE